MNYNKIKIELEKRKITIKEFCKKLNITEQGLHQMIRNGSMKVELLERISKILGIPISFWFDENTNIEEARSPKNKYPEKLSEIRSVDIDAITNNLNKLLKYVLENTNN